MSRSYFFFIADDDEDDRELFISALKQIEGTNTCSSAANGADALRQLADETMPVPDFIFLDLNMPRINGRQCLEKLKTGNHRLEKVPVIIYSTTSNETEAAELKKLGAAFFYKNPINFPTSV